MSFAEAFILARQALGLTQKQIAKELKTSFCTINRWENGKHIPNEMTLSVLTQFFEDKGIRFEFEAGSEK